MRSPVLIFAYNRPASLRQLIDSLRKCRNLDDRKIYVYVDGPKKEEERAAVSEVISVARELTPDVRISESNRGLADSIIKGVREILTNHDRVIVLEDDLVLHRDFLNYMDHYLERCKEDKRILSICGYSLQVKRPAGYDFEVYLSGRASSWGWGTWADRWEKVDWEVNDFQELERSRSLRRSFNEGGSDMFGMLRDYIKGKNASWAIRFCYHQWKNGMYSVHPMRSLVLNEGFSTAATHCRQKYNRFKTLMLPEEEIIRYNDATELNVDSRIEKELRKYHSIPLRIYSKLRKILNI